jgi:hypothetical protein
MSTTNELAIQMPEPEFKTPTAEIPQHITEPVPQPAPTPAPSAQLSAQHERAVDFANPETVDNGASVQRHGTWSKGAGASGPGAHSHSASLSERVSVASNALDDETRGRIAKAESETSSELLFLSLTLSAEKDAKRLSKIIIKEGKAEDSHLKAAIKELEGLQKAQKHAASEEVKAASAVSKASRAEQQTHAKFIEARAVHERAVATLTNLEESLKAKKEHAEKRTEVLQRQADEVDSMRQRKAVDDVSPLPTVTVTMPTPLQREREAKLVQLREGKIVAV